MAENSSYKRSGGVNISGHVGVVHGDIIGRDKVIQSDYAAVEAAFAPLKTFIDTELVSQREEANAKLTLLREEAAKGNRSSDTVLARLVESLISVVPGAASAVVSAFATPILGVIVGPVTAYVIDKLRSP